MIGRGTDKRRVAVRRQRDTRSEGAVAELLAAASQFRTLLDKRIEGFSVIFHLVSYQSVGLSTLQSRATAGLIGGVFVFCLPGSNGAVKDGWDKVIAAQLDSRHRPCNMVELMPRLLET